MRFEDAIRAAGNRLVRPANIFHGVGLHVEHVDVTRPAELEKKHHRFHARFAGLGRRHGLGAQQAGQGKTEQAKAADLDCVSA